MKKGSRVGQIIAFVVIGIIVLVGGAWLYLSNMLPIHPSINVLPNYDNKVDTQVVKLGKNTAVVTPNELPKLMENTIQPVVKGEYPNVSVLFPVKMTENNEIKTSTSHLEVGIDWIKRDPARTEMDKNVVNGKDLVIAKKGTEIIVPVNNAEVFQFCTTKTQMKWWGVVVRFNGPDQTPYELIITDYWNQSLPAEALKDVPVADDEAGYIPGLTIYKNMKGLALSAGTPIIKTNADYMRLKFELCVQAFKVSNAKIPSTYTMEKSNFSFVTIEDTNGNDKVAVLSSN